MTRNKYDWDKIKEDYLRGFNIPELKNKYGACESTIHKALVSRGVKMRNLSEARLFKSDNWRILTRVTKVQNSKCNTRLLSIPTDLLNQLGFTNPNQKLEGKWKIIYKDGYVNQLEHNTDCFLGLEIRERK